MQGFGYRILPNNDPNINQSFYVIPEGPGFSNGLYPNSNYMMSKKSSKKHRKHKHRHRHRHYEGQYGQFGMPILSPEFLSPEFPVPVPVPVPGYGYGYGYTDPANIALTQITKAANDAVAATAASQSTVIAAVRAVLGNLNNPGAQAVVAATNKAFTTLNSAITTKASADHIIAEAKAAVTTYNVPGMPFGNISPIISPVLSPRFGNVRHITDPDSDPELRRKVVKHFYKELKEKYFIDKFNKFFQYIIIENNEPRIVKTYEEYKKNENVFTDSNKKIKFITENIFTKYDLEVLISKLIAKYGMLNSDDENNMHWYNSKNRYAGLIKKAMYKKIKYRFEKKVDF